MTLLISEAKNISITGASFETGNLGVSALAWSSVKLIKTCWPDSAIRMMGGRQPRSAQVWLCEHHETIQIWPVRYCPNMLAAHHIFKLWVAICLCCIFPFLKKRWANYHSTLGVLLRSDIVSDITGGDSFSDIYGLRRLFRGFLLKRLCQMTGKPYILLPQTYGPFRSCLARWMARSVLSRASAIYSRDQEGLEQIRRLMGSRKMKAEPKLCPDVAFVLEARKPKAVPPDLDNLKLNTQHSKLIGVNISGLLYNGGYTQNNQFGLACDYRSLVKGIISFFANQPDHYVLLVPHVIPDNMPVENDLDACKAVWDSLTEDIKERVIVADGQYDQNEIKYIIGLCDFFLGARMHATIAALSQCIPAVGMAYSKKFAGVFETVGVEGCVVDMRTLNDQEILSRIQELYGAMMTTRQTLKSTIPIAQQKVLSIFQTLNE